MKGLNKAWLARRPGIQNNGIVRSRSVAAILFVGALSIAIATWVCFHLGAGVAVVGFIYLIEVLLVSVMGSLVSSVAISLIAAGCLNFFFTEPLFAFRVDAPQDIAALTAFFATSLVVTFLVHRTRRLAAIHREQAQLLDLTHDSVVARDMDDVITYWNSGAQALYGWNKQEALGHLAHGLLHTRFPAALDDIKRTLTETGRWEGEIVNTRRDGSEVAVASRWALVRDEQGRPIATLETGTDITERKRLEDALQQVSRLTSIGEFGASVAHEIAQPLAAVATDGAACLRWIDRDVPELEKARASVQRMLNDAERATEIIKRVRMLAKRTAPEMTSLRINEVINEVMVLLQREVLKHNVALRATLASKLPAVRGGRIELAQVITNLITNGIQAMSTIEDRPRELTIRSWRSDDGYVVVSVQDCGTGIDLKHADRLFEPFFTTKPQGMGVGLSISRSIIDAHGGRVWAENNAGYGATFHFNIPAIGDSE